MQSFDSAWQTQMMDQSTSTSPSSPLHDEPQGVAEPVGAPVHAALFLAMALVAGAAATLAYKALAITPAAAMAIGLFVLSVSLAVHVGIAARATATSLDLRAGPRAAKLRTQRPALIPTDTAREADLAEGAADAAASSGHRLPEPSEIAIELLRRVGEPVVPQLNEPLVPSLRFDHDAQALSSLAQRPSWDEPAGLAPLAEGIFGVQPTTPVAPQPLRPETEVQRVERLVKRLADEVNAREQAGRLAAAAVPTSAVPPPLPQALIPVPPFAPETVTAVPAAVGSSSLALDPVADQLSLDLTSAIASLPKWPEPVAAPRLDELAMERLEAILSALHAQRIDVFLEPILGLNDQRPQHYEVSIGLRATDGQTLNLAEAASSLSGTGLLPLIDSARIAKAAQMARRLAERGKTGAVLTEFRAESLQDRETQVDLTGRPSAGAFPGQLVLMLPQAQVRLFSAADWQTLARLRAAGFGFALTDVTSLDMDFAALAQGGFSFARLDAETFLVGLPTSDGMVDATGICRHIAQSGLVLIVGRIVDDVQLAKIFGFGVLFGQGQLFGGARPVAAPVPRLEVQVASAAE